jgi:septum formation protein
MRLAGPIWLGSASPRRQLLLEEAGIPVHVMPPDIDDAELQRGFVTPEQWVMALAYFKARRVAQLIEAQHPTAHRRDSRTAGTVLAADTVCVHREVILGQPRTADHAREMLKAMRDDVHRTITGVCLLPLPVRDRRLCVDVTEVCIGPIPDHRIERYIESGDWRGKAGAYNLSERLADGWPIECRGDTTTVMGLPMNRLVPWLESVEN